LAAPALSIDLQRPMASTTFACGSIDGSPGFHRQCRFMAQARHMHDSHAGMMARARSPRDFHGLLHTIWRFHAESSAELRQCVQPQKKISIAAAIAVLKVRRARYRRDLKGPRCGAPSVESPAAHRSHSRGIERRGRTPAHVVMHRFPQHA